MVTETNESSDISSQIFERSFVLSLSFSLSLRGTELQTEKKKNGASPGVNANEKMNARREGNGYLRRRRLITRFETDDVGVRFRAPASCFCYLHRRHTLCILHHLHHPPPPVTGVVSSPPCASRT